VEKDGRGRVNKAVRIWADLSRTNSSSDSRDLRMESYGLSIKQGKREQDVLDKGHERQLWILIPRSQEQHYTLFVVYYTGELLSSTRPQSIAPYLPTSASPIITNTACVGSVRASFLSMDMNSSAYWGPSPIIIELALASGCLSIFLSWASSAVVIWPAR
jgi:hypothetical protein